MSAHELIAEIEGGAFVGNLMLASSTHSLLRRIAEHPVTRQAKRLLVEQPELPKVLLKQAVKLFESPGPEGYLHPGDMPLATYIFLLARVPRRDVHAFLDRVAKADRPDLFAATSVAGYFASRVPETTVRRPKIQNEDTSGDDAEAALEGLEAKSPIFSTE